MGCEVGDLGKEGNRELVRFLLFVVSGSEAGPHIDKVGSLQLSHISDQLLLLFFSFQEDTISETYIQLNSKISKIPKGTWNLEP